MYQLTKYEESLCKEIVDSFKVLRGLEPGFLKKYMRLIFVMS